MAATAGELSLAQAATSELGVLNETGLVARCRAGDPEAFARLVALHEGMVFGLAVRLLGDPEEARDASQEVFLQVYRSLGRFEGRSSLKTWIYRIVLNHCRNRQRWWRRRRKGASVALDDLAVSEEARMVADADQPSPLALVQRREQHRRIQQALGLLSFDHRAVLLLKEVEGLPCEAVATALGIAVGTVKSRLARAREAMRLRLLGLEKGALP